MSGPLLNPSWWNSYKWNDGSALKNLNMIWVLDDVKKLSLILVGITVFCLHREMSLFLEMSNSDKMHTNAAKYC